jgi:hypothetical protein
MLSCLLYIGLHDAAPQELSKYIRALSIYAAVAADKSIMLLLFYMKTPTPVTFFDVYGILSP